MAEQPDWAPVAEKAVGVLGHASDVVQIVFTLSVATVLLAAIAAWFVAGRRRKSEDSVPAAVLITVTEEFSRQVGNMTIAVEGTAEVVAGLALVVEEMRSAIKGCSTCHYNPHARKDQP